MLQLPVITHAFWHISALMASPTRTKTTTTTTASPNHQRNGVHNTRPASSAGAGSPTMEIKSRLVLLGESAVGKTSLVLQFVNGQFNDHQESTIGGENLSTGQ